MTGTSAESCLKQWSCYIIAVNWSLSPLQCCRYCAAVTVLPLQCCRCSAAVTVLLSCTYCYMFSWTRRCNYRSASRRECWRAGERAGVWASGGAAVCWEIRSGSSWPTGSQFKSSSGSTSHQCRCIFCKRMLLGISGVCACIVFLTVPFDV